MQEFNDPKTTESIFDAAIQRAKTKARQPLPPTGEGPVKDAIQTSSEATVDALSNVLPQEYIARLKKQHEAKAVKPNLIDGCKPRDPNMKTLRDISSQMHDLAKEVAEIEADPKHGAIGKGQLRDGNTLRRNAANMIAETCRPVPTVLHGEGVDDIKECADTITSFYNYMKEDLLLQKKGDLKKRVQLEIKRSTATCTKKNTMLSDEETVIDCNRRVWDRIAYMLKEYKAPT